MKFCFTPNNLLSKISLLDRSQDIGKFCPLMYTIKLPKRVGFRPLTNEKKLFLKKLVIFESKALSSDRDKSKTISDV